MKLVAIIYALSWLILLILYICSLFGKNKTTSNTYAPKNNLTSNTDAPWYIYAIMIGFAPITVLLIPYILWDSWKEDREIKRKRKEEELREKEEQDRREQALNRLEKSKQDQPGSISNEYVDIAQALNQAVREKSYDSIQTIMDKIVTPEYSKLIVQECDECGSDIGDISKLAIRFKSGQIEYDVFDRLRFEDSCSGAWQAYLLHQLWHSLPLFWHADYFRRDYLFSKDDFASVKHWADDDAFPDLSNMDLTPTVIKTGDFYSISACYWSEFEGLIREYVELRFDDGKLTEFVNFKEDTLYKYKCEIYF